MKTKAPIPLTHLEREGKARGIVGAYFAFVHLKRLFRQGWLWAGVPEAQCESVAEHSFATALLALLVAEEKYPDLDRGRIVEIALLHDLAEAYAGDITVHDGVPREEKERLEREAMERLLDGLEGRERLMARWEEYESQSSPEAVLVKQMDRVEMALQASVYEHELGLDLGQFFDSARRAIVSEEAREVFDEVVKSRPRSTET